MLRALIVSFAVVSTTLATTASAQNFPSRNELASSSWDSTYTTPDGDSVAATIEFNGANGTFDTSFGQGRLSDIQYGVDTQTNPGNPFFQITGKWAFLGDGGRFTLQSSGATRFHGSWSGSQGGGRWNGTRIFNNGPPANGGGGMVGGGGGGDVDYADSWSYSQQKNYYYKRCTFPQGGYQYIIWYPEKPQWIYWYNPTKQVTWCACPTMRHPDFGRRTGNGEDLFLMATQKARDPKLAVFPDNAGANFQAGATAVDADGSTVALGCPPTDLP